MYEVVFVIMPIVGELGHGYWRGMPFDEFDLIVILGCALGMNLVGMVILLFQFIKRFNEIQNRK